MWRMVEQGANNAGGVVVGAVVNGVVGQGMIHVGS